MRIAFDIETDGLYLDATVIHSLVLRDIDTDQCWSCHDHNPNDPAIPTIEWGLKRLTEADEVIGHNIIGYDLPVIRKLYPWFAEAFNATITDTYTLATLTCPLVEKTDFKRQKSGTFPGNLIGSHSLEAWGHRLNRWKGDYARECKAQGIDPWATWNPEMQRYCEQDVFVTVSLYRHLIGYPEQPPAAAVQMETEVAILCSEITVNGFPFNVDAAERLYADLLGKRAVKDVELRKFFDGWWKSKGIKTPAKSLKYKDPARASRTKGESFTEVEWVEFNPRSRAHIQNRLTTLYNWQPQEFTQSGEAKLDDEIISALPYECAPMLAEYLLLDKRIGQIAEGKQAWLTKQRNGYIHGGINPNATVSGRASHSNPNIAQVPSSDAPYGEECRGLFHSPPGWLLVGTDMSGLELRTLAHFMARYDEGAYAREVLVGDVHTVNQTAAVIPTRPQAKTFIYALIYGAGDAKLGSIVSQGRAAGLRMRQNISAKIPALGKLVDAVKKGAKRGYLMGLDKRVLLSRASHSALNTVLQSAGALLCKWWMVRLHLELKARGYKHGWDGDYAIVAWVHDELQIAARTEALAHEIGKLSQDVAKKAGVHFKIRLPITSDYKVGLTWAETH